MKKHIRKSSILIVALILWVMPFYSFGETRPLTLTAKGAVLIDQGTGTVLFEQNAHEKLPPASVTKVMSMLLAVEALERGQVSLDDMVSISDRAAKMGGSQLFMEPGEQQKLSTLLKGIAICSANDACVAVAEHVAGSEEAFVNLMNQRAGELGMKNTHFVNTNGLPVANHYTTAYDIGLMSRELMKHKQTKEWFTTWTDTIVVGLPSKKQTNLGITNTNRLIRMYPGATGIKTGYTADAKYCLSGSATKGNLSLIGVVLGVEASTLRFQEMSKLLDYGFAVYDNICIATKDKVLGSIGVEKGVKEKINVISASDINVLIKKDEKQKIRKEMVLNQKVSAPVRGGDDLGKIMVYKDNQLLSEYPLTTQEEVLKAGPLKLYLRMFHSTFQ